MEGHLQCLHELVIRYSSKSLLFDEFDSEEKQNLIYLK